MSKIKDTAGQPVEIEIMGQKYTISGESDPNYMKSLARYVDKKMQEIAANAGNLPQTKLALLAAVNITHELFHARNLQKAKETFVSKKTRDLIDTIDQEFGDLKLY
jgi:cell division protein ZapA